MRAVATEIWEDGLNDEQLHYIGQRSGKTVFKEMYDILEQEQLIPDEGFRLGREFDYGIINEFPKQYNLHCFVRWGGCEGIYIDVILTPQGDQAAERESICFATGKTLDESEEAFDRMVYLGGYIYRLFNGNGIHRPRHAINDSDEINRKYMLLLKKANDEFTLFLKHTIYQQNRSLVDYELEVSKKANALDKFAKNKLHFTLTQMNRLLEKDNFLDYLCKRVASEK